MKTTKLPLALSEARLKAVHLMPYMQDVVLSLVMIERPGLGTFAVDQWGRCYYDPAFLKAHNAGENAVILLHEGYHVFLQHHTRLKGAPHEAANVAKDLAINSMLASSGLPKIKEGLYPDQFRFPDDRTTEEYYELMEKLAEKNPGKGRPGDGKSPGGLKPGGKPGPGGDGVPGTDPGDPYNGIPPDPKKGDGGSGTDGEQKPWECPAPNDDPGNAPGLSEYDIEQIVDSTARNILKHQGNIPGSLRRIARTIIDPPTDPFKLYETSVRYSAESTGGFGAYSYQRPSRRILQGGAILPHHRKPISRPVVLIDTSGSMAGRDLALALGATQRGLRMYRDLLVVCGDTQANSVNKVFRPDQIKLCGGGGTDMTQLIEDAMKLKPKPTLLVVISDGYTSWPAEPVDCPVIVALTQSDQGGQVPSWMKVCELDPKREL